MDIRSGMAGTLSNLFANEGDTVAVGKPLYEIDDAGKKPDSVKTHSEAQTQTPTPGTPTPPKPAEKTPPLAQKEAKPKTTVKPAEKS